MIIKLGELLGGINKGKIKAVKSCKRYAVIKMDGKYYRLKEYSEKGWALEHISKDRVLAEAI